MARLNLRLKENAPGPLYVDETCIDCDTCRQMAPEVYGETRGLSYVMRQPESADEKLRALQALVACPTASIGGAKGAEVEHALGTFPQRIAGAVYDCGLRSESSYGATSYLVVGGVIYHVLAIYGAVIGNHSAANFVPLNTADNWLHLVLGLGMVALGLIGGRARSQTTGTVR